MIDWLKRYGWLALVALGAVLSWVVFRRHPPVRQIKAELEGIRAERDAKIAIAVDGKEAALAQVQQRYEAQVGTLEAHEKAEAEKLAGDPQALAGFLARAGARRSGQG